jgi:integrase/recombinase XerC
MPGERAADLPAQSGRVGGRPAAAGENGHCPVDLLQVGSSRPAAPTFAEYIPVVSAAVSSGTRRVYGSYWNRILDHWGPRRLDEPTPSEIQRLAEYVRAHVVAAEHLIAALRCLP